MKGLKPMTTAERQANHRADILLNDGKRLSVTLSREALAALQVIQIRLEKVGQNHTKRAAIETALIEYAEMIDNAAGNRWE